MRLRSGKILTMGKDEDTAAAVVSHSITNFKSGIEPFAGKVNGTLVQGVEIFIESVENHLANRRITDPHDRFVEAKAHLNLSRGDPFSLGIVKLGRILRDF